MPEPIKRKIPITIGCDPEMFLLDKSTGAFISAHDRLPGTKEKPFSVPSGAIQVDGVAAEFNINPAKTASTFANNCWVVMDQIKETLGSEVDLLIQPTCTFDKDYFDKLPGVARELGCNPDFNAWTGQRNPSPDTTLGTMRTASGHIHIGWTKNRDPNDPDHYEDCRVLVKQLDYLLGAPSLLWDADTKRRTLYGRAGAFRPKPYGVEYRVLSNRWLQGKELAMYVFNMANSCVTNLLNGGRLYEEKYGNLAETVINESQRWWDVKSHPMYSFWRNEVGNSLPTQFKDPAWDSVKEVKAA